MKAEFLFNDIAKWQAKMFPKATPASAAEHLRREIREIHEHYYEFDEDSETHVESFGYPPTDEVAEECADALHLLIQLATAQGFDLLEATAKKFEKNKARKWKAPDEYGVVEHEE